MSDGPSVRPLGCGRDDVELVPCPCRFARYGDPSKLKPSSDIINVPSERLSAPPGGNWWIQEDLGMGHVQAKVDGAGLVDLEVVHNRIGAGQGDAGPFVVLRVPAHLAPGTRLELGNRKLTVAPPTAGKVDISALSLKKVYRADLGGTGFMVKITPEQRTRVFITAGYAMPPGARFVFGVHILKGLLMADAPRLCDVQTTKNPNELFVPMWNGQLEQAFGLFVYDADNFDNSTGAIVQ